MGCSPCEEAAAKRRTEDAKRQAAREAAAAKARGEVRQPAPASASAKEKPARKSTAKKSAAKQVTPAAPSADAPVVLEQPAARRGAVPEGATVIPPDPRVFSGQRRQSRFQFPTDKDGRPIVNTVPRQHTAGPTEGDTRAVGESPDGADPATSA